MTESAGGAALSPLVQSDSESKNYAPRVGMAGERLTARQRTLWKRADQPGGLAQMSVDELTEWAAACRALMSQADTRPAKSAKARRMWRQRLREAEDVLAERQ